MDLMILIDQLIANYGLLGLFIAALVSNASLFFVVPIDVLIFLLGGTNYFHPLLVGLVAGLGAAIGESTGYLIGLGGVKTVESTLHKHFEKLNFIRRKIKKWGMIFIFLGSFTPFPFDIIGLACGVIKYSYKRFFIATFFGKLLRYLVIVYAGVYGFELVKGFFLISA